MPVDSELVARLQRPIRDEAPAGDDLRYDPRVDLIREARREELDLPGNNAEVKRKLADWPQVIDLTATLLAEETKDLQLAAWLTEALLHRDSYAGLATGLRIVAGLLEHFWEPLHPQPEDDEDDVRVGPIEWIGAKLPIPLRMAPFGPSRLSFLQLDEARSIPGEREAEQQSDKREQREQAVADGKIVPEVATAALDALNKGALRAILADLDAAQQAIGAVDAVADRRFGAMAPSLLPLRNGIDDIKRFVAPILASRLETDPDPIVDTEGEESATAPTAVDEAGGITSEPVNRADAMQRIGIVARWLRANDPGSPAPYLLLRGARWGELRASAPDVDPRLLEAPATALRSRLKSLLLDGRWADLLEQAEQLMAMPAGRGWLDLQRYVLTACGNLGGLYDPVAMAVRSELRALLVALPTLSRMTLMDDTPTANEETRVWLKAEGLEPEPEAAGQPDPANSMDMPSDAPDVVDDTETATVLAEALEDDASSAQQGGFSRARPVRRAGPRPRDAFDLACAELAQNKPHAAVERLMAELAREQSPRGRVVRQVQIAYVMVEAGLDAVAQPILQRVIETIDERQLEQWESGPLVAQPLALMCRVLDRADGDLDLRQQLYLRVCRLDPLQALALRPR